jgi:hypothetical protein
MLWLMTRAKQYDGILTKWRKNDTPSAYRIDLLPLYQKGYPPLRFTDVILDFMKCGAQFF